jgi:hypothetical protein
VKIVANATSYQKKGKNIRFSDNQLVEIYDRNVAVKVAN